MKNKNTFFLLFFTLLAQSGLCQVFPVQGNAALIPPFSLKLSDYGSSINDRVAVNILLADPSRPELIVRMRLRIESQSLKIETKQEYIGTAITLQGGIPLRLTNIDLGEYFNPDNLNFSGISKSEFLKTGSLPEGFYQFCFEVLEYNRGVKISNTVCAPAWLILNDPPIINAPGNGEKVKPLLPQNVVFQWTPRHTGSPNSAFTTEYDFQLVELWPSDRNPNDAILSQPPIYELTTNSTLLVYGPDATPLEPGRHYAFRVRARSITGVDELDLFKNNGYSQVSSFIYGDACDAPQNVIADPMGSSRFGLRWQENFNHTGYSVNYRLANDANANWYTTNSLTNDIQINSLKPSTRYEYQVSASCGSYESNLSPIASVTTKGSETIAYSCGLPLTPFNLDPSQLIEILKVGDIIQAGDFEVVLSKITGGNGIFTGEGVIEVPYFNKAKVKAEFSNISVNKELRMVAGVMNITGAGVDIIPTSALDFMDDLSEALAVTDSLIADYEANLPEQFDPHSFVAAQEIKVPGSIAQVYSGEGGAIIVVDDKGNKQAIPAGATSAITDTNGNGYLVDAKGNIHKTTATIAAVAAHREYNLGVKFANATDATFGFDEKKHDPIANTYEKIDGKYDVAWKSVATGQTDKVRAILEGTNIDKSKIRFEQAGLPLSLNAQVFTIQGKADGVEEGLIALFTPADSSKKEQVLGKLNVVTYNSLQKTVVIVPVNGTTFNKFGTASMLRDSLNWIYNQAVANWNVEMAEGIWVAGISPFDDGGSRLLSNYTGHMKSVINTYKDSYPNSNRNNTYYLFLVSNAKDPGTLGYMPRSKESGFIFADKHSSLGAIARTMAHELGHGAFNLHHTFLEPNFTLTKGTTDNLMDYPAGPKLYKYQWDKMRYPDIVMELFESDEEGALVSETQLQQVTRIINTLNCGYRKKLSEIDLHYGTTRFDVNLGKLAIALNSGNSILASNEFRDAQITIWFGGYSISEPFLSYNDFTATLGGYRYTTNDKITISGKSGAMGIRVSEVGFRAPLKKSDVFEWLEEKINRTGTTPALLSINNNKPWKKEDLHTLSPCDLEQLNKTNRLSLIKELVNSQESQILGIGTTDKDTYQYLLINILRYTPKSDQLYFLNQLIENPKWVLYPYEVMDLDQREKYVKLITEWWLEYREGISLSIPTNTVVINYSIFNNPDNLVESSSDYTKIDFKKRGLNNVATYRPEETLCSPSPLEVVNVSFKSQTIDKKSTQLPAILVKYMIDKGNLQDVKDLGWATLNVATLVTGVGEINLAVQTLKNSRYVLGSLRLLLGATDVISTINSTYCTQAREETNFCKEWSKYELLIGIGLVSASSLDLLYDKLSKAYKELPPGSFTSAQKELLEGELALNVPLGGVFDLIEKAQGDIYKFFNAVISADYKIETVGNIIKVYTKKGTDILAEISEGSIRIKYSGWGGDIVTKSDRTTTCIAKFDDQFDPPGSQFIKSEIPEGGFGRGVSNNGGINILDVDKPIYDGLRIEAEEKLKNLGKSYTNNDIIKAANEIFWDRYNLPFLEEAFIRGDDVRLLSDPTTLFGSTGFYQREIEAITLGWKKLDGSYMEALVKKYNYSFNTITKTYEKVK